MKAMKTKTLKWVNICNNFLYSYKNKKDFAVKSIPKMCYCALGVHHYISISIIYIYKKNGKEIH